MDISGYVDQLRTDLAAAAAAGDEAMQRSAERLVTALDAAVRMALLEALSDAAADITASLDGTVVEVRLKGRDPQFVVISPADSGDAEVPADSDPGSDDAPTARITLRLPDALKGRAEAAAARTRQSLNTWLVDAVRAAADGSPPPERRGAGQRLSGWAR